MTEQNRTEQNRTEQNLSNNNSITLKHRINRRFGPNTRLLRKIFTFAIRRDLKFEVWFWLYLNSFSIFKWIAIWRLNSKYNVHIGSKAKIDSSIYIHHAISVVIGNCVIKKGVSIYQGVTLGSASSYSRDQDYQNNRNPYPTLEEDVTVCSNACILGGITIGRGAVIAAGTIVTEDVPPYTLVKGNPAQIIKVIEPGKHPFTNISYDLNSLICKNEISVENQVYFGHFEIN